MIKHHLVPFVLLFSIFGIIACNNTPKTTSDKPFSDCQYGPPKAIFSKEMLSIQNHQFELKAQSAIEKVDFEEGIQLELVQSGCEKPRQEFQFMVPRNTKSYTDADWINLSLDMFSFMGNLSESLKPFLFWQGALKEKRSQLKLGLPQELEQGFFVKLDKVAGEDSGIIFITLYRE